MRAQLFLKKQGRGEQHFRVLCCRTLIYRVTTNYFINILTCFIQVLSPLCCMTGQKNQKLKF